MNHRIRFRLPSGLIAIDTQKAAASHVAAKVGISTTTARERLKRHADDALKLYAPADEGKQALARKRVYR